MICDPIVVSHFTREETRMIRLRKDNDHGELDYSSHGCTQFKIQFLT
jgi:hypothetical protein